MISSSYSIAWKRAIGTGLMTLVLLLSLTPSLTILASTHSGCATNCCRHKKTCSCRKTRPQTGAAFSAVTCPPNCGHTNNLPAFAAATAVPLAEIARIPANPASLPALQLPALNALLCFALSQRPPPYHLHSTN